VTFGAVIAAAGLSSRMGAFKPLVPLGNSTIIERVITTLREGGVQDIAVVTGRDAALIEATLVSYRLTFIYNKDYATTDMFYSASMGFKVMAEQVGGIFFTPADIPLFKADTVRFLAEAMQNSNSHIIIPTYRHSSGHPIVMRSAAAKEILHGKNENGLKGAIAAYCGGAKDILDVDDPGILYDSDTPDDYQFLLSQC
jgi:CTP:molybdopterin cytidylyltransferase MocA